jgi:hypothetical protein
MRFGARRVSLPQSARFRSCPKSNKNRRASNSKAPLEMRMGKSITPWLSARSTLMTVSAD